ncbi:MAG: hypothetical protein ICV81_17595 [Flavisolibacter sp.]|nr:hypothetical protein [Flavisolibacter sp.]MBD0296401.1 hypothetical protein [Flavisolibacter sp.]MBD0366740.1 hypothetical protein [Flavisolibacter sp.]
MNYIIKHANGGCTRIGSPLTIEDLFTLIKDNEDQFILYNDAADDAVFMSAGCVKRHIMTAKEKEVSKMKGMVISDYF